VHIHINAKSDVDRHDAIELDVSIISETEIPVWINVPRTRWGKKVKFASSLHTKIEGCRRKKQRTGG
jgi:hypothetical protein